MTEKLITDLYGPISSVRLEKYRGNDDLAMITNYFWNIDLAEALVPSLHAVEVALRNSIHAAFADHYGTDMWFYQEGLLQANQIRDFAFALGKVAKRPAPHAGRLVAELNFGFWTSLLNSPYEQRVWLPNKSKLLFTVFPNATGHSRKEIEERFTMINALRNRTFHYEPIWHDPDLLQKHTDIHEAIRWMSLPLHKAIHSVDNFQDAYSNKNAVREHLRKLMLAERLPEPQTPSKNESLYDPIDYIGVPLG